MSAALGIVVLAVIGLCGFLFVFALIVDLIRHQFRYTKILLKVIGYSCIALLLLVAIYGAIRAFETTQKGEKDLKESSIAENSVTETSPLATPAGTSILDYYYSIPNEFLNFKLPDTKEEREKWITKKDLKNHYVEVSHKSSDPDIEGNATLATFITPQKNHIVAVESRYCQAPSCSQNFYLVALENEKWKDVTSVYMPLSFDELISKTVEWKQARGFEDLPAMFYLRIPQFGTTIETYDRDHNPEKAIYSLNWNNGKFILSDPLL